MRLLQFAVALAILVVATEVRAGGEDLAIVVQPNVPLYWQDRVVAQLQLGDVVTVDRQDTTRLMVRSWRIGWIDRGAVRVPREASEHLSQLLQARNTSELYYARAMARWCSMEPAGLQDCEAALRLDPQNWRAMLAQSNFLIVSHRQNEARALINRAVEMSRGANAALFERARMYDTAGDDQRALDDYNAMVLRDPGNGWLRAMRCWVLMQLKQYDAAIEDATFAVNFYPHFQGVYLSRATAWQNKNEMDRALQDLARELEIYPHSTGAYHLRVTISTLQKNHKQVLSDANRLLMMDPDDEIGLFARAMVHFEGKKFDLAVDDFTRLLTHDDDHLMARYLRAACYMSLERFEDAIADLNVVIVGQDENLPMALCTRAMAYSKLGNEAQSKSDIQTALKINPNLFKD